MLSDIISDIVWARTGNSLFVTTNGISNLIKVYKLCGSLDGSLKLSDTVNIMNVHLDILLSVWPKSFLTCRNGLRDIVVHMYSIGYCKEEGDYYNLLYHVVILNLSFASLHKRKKFLFNLHGSPFLLSVPFEDIFPDDVANDWHSFLKLHCMSMSDIFSWLVNVVII